MTDYGTTQPIELTEAQLINIRALGQVAEADIAAAGSGPPPVGVWKAMYSYIFGLINPTPSGAALQAPSAQQYWFEQAQYITADNENVPSGYFVRDVTALGFGVASPSDPTVQAVSNAIGQAIYNSIIKTGKLPAFWQQLNDDIYSALGGGTTPYPYPQLTIEGWGGTFYYLNAPYAPGGSINETAAPSTSVGQYVLGNATANQTFITNYSQAIANTVSQFQSAIPQTSQLVSSFLSGLKGIANLYNSGWQGKLDIVELVAQSLIDYAALGGSTAILQSALISFVQFQVGLDIGSGSASITAAGDANVLVGGQDIGSAGNDTLTGGGNLDTFLVNLPATGSVTQTIYDNTGLGQIVVSNNGQFDILGGSAADPLKAVAGEPNTWKDTGGTQYVYSPSSDDLIISGGYLGAGNEIVVDDFNIGIAAGTNPISGIAGGFAGIFLPGSLSLNATANAGMDPPAPNFIEGSSQSYTLSVDAPSTAAQTFSVTLSGALPTDFEVLVGDTIEQLSLNGTFNVSLAAGETNVSFALIDTTPDNSSSDIAGGATLQLTASLPNLVNPSGPVIQAASLTFNYTPTPSDAGSAPQGLTTIAGTLTGGVTDYDGDGDNDYIAAGAGPNFINATNSINDSLVGGSGSNTIYGGSGSNVISLAGSHDFVSLGGGFNTLNGGSGEDTIYSNNSTSLIIGNSGTDIIIAGNGTNAIYAGTQTSLATAIATASSGSATSQRGDLIAVGDGNNTVVGGNGNDLIFAGAGSDVIVMGPGNDTFEGGMDVTLAVPNWNATFTPPNGSTGANLLVDSINSYTESYSNPYPQPYDGIVEDGTQTPAGPANDTIYGGTGNEVLYLGNGNNYVEAGSGTDYILGGMGNDTIIAGSGADYVSGGGGTTYIEGSSGVSTLIGGDGNNTIIGGSGNATITSANGPTATWANENLEQNYVDGGSGNDVIFGSGGADTLIAGTGNTTIYGGSGYENIVGGSGNDLLVGGAGNDTIAAGGAGRDSLFANGVSSSTSYLYGGNGQDYIGGGSGTNILNAGDGGTAGAATSVFASQGDATATTTIYGGLGVDLLVGGAGTSVIYGGDGGTSAAPTTIIGGSGNDTLYGGLGTDLVQGGTAAAEALYAGDGGTSSAPTTVLSGTGADTLYGGAGPSDIQDQLSGHDLLISGSANDSLVGIGNDTLVAGTGNDLLQANSGSVNFEFNPGFGSDTIIANGGTANLLLGSGILATDFTASVNLDGFGNSYLNLTGDGGSIAIEGGLTGALTSAAYVDPSSIPLQTLLTDVFGGDQTIASGSDNFIVNVANNESVAAGDFNDTISSWGNNVTITGGSFGYGDSIYSVGSDASISSVYGNDSINATGANDSIIGGTYGDHITVAGANDVVTSSSGIDSVTASGSNDTLIASSGINRFYVNNASTVIEVTGAPLDDIVNASVSYTAPTNVNILILTGSSSIVGTGNSGNDTLMGGTGNDTLVAGQGIATLEGGTGNTTFVVNSTSDVVQDTSSTANNSVQSSVSYVLPTLVNTLVLTGTAALTGTANSGNDTITSNTGVDTLIGGAGNDVFVLYNVADVVEDTAGTATIIYALASNFTLPTGINNLTLLGTAPLVATGNAGNDSLTANSGADTLIAGNGNDTLVSGGGSAVDSLVGGTGNDMFVVSNAADVVTVGGTHGLDTIQASVSYTAAANVANLTLTGSANLTATGNTLANVIRANGGNDMLIAGSGVATLVGGAAGDTFVIDNAGDVIQNVSATSSNTLQSSVSATLMTNVNTLVLTGTGNLTGTANSGADTLTANTGVDTLVGSSGSDTFVISNSSDVIQDTSTTAANSILSSVAFTLPTNVNSLTLTGTAALVATGNAANDVITANTGADTLVAGSGTDTLISGTTAVDSLVGGSGADQFIVNNSGDSVSAISHSGVDTILASVSFTLPTLISALTLTGSANLTGAAVSGSNSITGNAGNDVLQAGSGYDTLVAGSGIDTFVGGSSYDTFVINNAADVLENLSTVGNTVVSSVNYTMPTNVVTLTLTGNANLQATGNAQTDEITANSGNDTLIAGSGTALFNAGTGLDVFVVNSAGDRVANNVPAEYAPDTIESSVSYTLGFTVNNLLLTGTANLSGTGNNTGATLAGDLIVGNAGLDTLTAGLGVDTLMAGSGLATLVGSSGTDTFVVNDVGDVVLDSVGGFSNLIVSSVNFSLPTNVNSILLTGSANIQATGNAANDSMTGGVGADRLIAGNGNDTLVAGAGLVTLIAGTGNDTFVLNSSSDLIQNASATSHNAAFSSATFVLPTNVNQLTLTGVANISGTGNGAADTLTAGAGNDTLIAGAGLATLIGGRGNTIFVVNSTSDVVQDAISTFSDTVQASVNYGLVTNVNNLVFTGTSALSGTANGASDTLTSNVGVDTLVGGAGNDTFVINNSSDVIQDTLATAVNIAQSSVNYTLATDVNTLVLTGTAALQGSANSSTDSLVSNAGIDTLVGGSGNDSFVISNSGDIVQDTSTTATNLIQSSVNFTLPTDVNALTLTGTTALIATGNAATNIITANAGNDTLVAGSGVATLIGGTGNETFVVNSTSDVVQDTVTSASNTLQASISKTLMTNVNTLVLTGTGNLTGIANSANDTLISNSGVDTLVGGAGYDLFIVNNSADVIQNATANDTIESSVNYTLPSTVNNLILIGTANIQGTGNANSDTLTTTGSGNDTLIAGSGVATLIGGAGNDTFVVNAYNDVVQDTSTITSNTILSSVNYSLPTNVDSLTFTGLSALTGTGNLDAANVLTANAGNDVLVGTAFSNTLNGGSGSDTIYAGSESNVIYSGNGGATSQLTVVYGNAGGTNVATESTIYGGSGANVLFGGPGSDLIYGGSGTVSIEGGSGFDTIYAGSNVENLSAGSGSNVIYGGAGDVLSDSYSGTSVLVAGAGAESLSGIGGDTLMAGSGTDFLYDSVTGVASTVYAFGPGFGRDTIGNGSAFNGTTTNASILFETGIAPSDLSISQGVNGNDFNPSNFALVINDGTGSIVVNGGLSPSAISSVTFSGESSESLTQFINSFGPTTTSLDYDGPGAFSVLSGGDGQTVSDTSGSDEFIWAFGNGDVVTEASRNSEVFAYGNNDTIASNSAAWVGGNNDSLTLGGSFLEDVTLAGGADILVTGNSNAEFVVDQSTDVIQVGAGAVADSIDAFANYTLPTNVAVLTLDSTVGGLAGWSNSQGGLLIAGANADTLTGGAGQDTLQALGSNDVLVGGSGSETFILNNATDSIRLGSGAASLNGVLVAFSYSLTSVANALTVTGSYSTGTGNSASDSLVAQGSYDTLIAGSGNDTLVDSTSTPTALVGGAGNDTFVVNNASDVIQDTSSTSTNTIVASVNYTLPTDINGLTLSGTSNLTGTANAGSDSLTGNAGNDTLVAGAGSDTLVGGAGTDTFVLNSGFGNDQIENAQNGDIIQFGSGIAQSSLSFSALLGATGTAPSLVISSSSGAVTVQGGLMPGAISEVSFTGGGTSTVPELVAASGRTTVAGSAGNLILSPNNDDSLTAGSGLDTVIAWGNNDTLNAGTGGTVIYAGGTGAMVTGGSASDTLSAIGANTTLIGGSGNETFVINTASAVIQVSADVGHDTVLSAVSYTVPTNVSQLTLIGTANLIATGNAGNDTITANTGSDTLVAGSGVATLVGGTGIDTFEVDSASDVVTSGSLQDQIWANSNYTLPSSVNILQLNQSGIVGTGNTQSDTLVANGDSDTIIAGSGNDGIVGNSDYDSLVGGSGNDTLTSYGINTLVGGSGNGVLRSYGGDSDLVSGSGIDTLSVGSDGDNTFFINNPADVIGSLAQYDSIDTTVSYTLPASLQLSFRTGIAWDLTGSNNVEVNAQNFGNPVTFEDQGTGNNTIVGNAGAVFIAGSGNDTFIGNVGGSNLFNINKSTDVVIATEGSTYDTLVSNASYTLPAYVDTLEINGTGLLGVGNSDNDTISASGSADTLIAGSGNDSLVSDGNAVLMAGIGNDTLTSSDPNDTLIAGSGNDLLNLLYADVLILNAGFGNSEVNYNTVGVPLTVDFGTGLSGSDLTASASLDANGNPALVISNGTGAVTLNSALANETYQFKFNGGSTLTLEQLLTQANVTTSSVAGASGNIILQGGLSTVVSGGTGNDTIYAAGANDTVTAGSGDQQLIALGTNDVLVGGSANDTLTGLGINDTLVAGAAVDTLVGGSGATVNFVVNNASDAIEQLNTSASDTVTSSVSYELPTGVNTLVLTGTAALTAITNGSLDEVISNSGDDTLDGEGGASLFIVNNASDLVQDIPGSDDTVQSAFSFTLQEDVDTLLLTGTAALTGVANQGTDGESDTLISNTGIDTLIGGAGGTLYILNNAADVVQEVNVTNDTVEAAFSYSLPANVDTLWLEGTANLTATANSGSDVLVSNTGIDTLIGGGSGGTLYVLNNAADVVLDANVNDTIETAFNYSLPSNVNTLWLSGTANLTGVANNNAATLNSNVGVDTLIGGSGNDTFGVSNSGDVIQDTSTTAINAADSWVSYSLATNVNTLILMGTLAIQGTANSGNDSITANTANDTLVAGSGTDTLVSGTTGADSLVGGSGSDTFFVNNTADHVTDPSTTSTNSISSTVSYTLPTNVNTLQFTGTAALKGTANSGNDSITANTGADTLVAAGAGTDTLVSGSTGTDSLVGGTGNDTFFVNNTADKVTDTSTAASNRISSTVSYTLPTDVNSLIFTGTAALKATGNSGNDSLTANTGADTLVAGSGTDTLVSGISGTDSLVGGSGNDTFFVNNTADKVTDTSSTAANSLVSSVTYTLPTGVNTLVLTGTTALVGTGNAHTDSITAGAGVDTLVAGSGVATLIGGAGNDTFVINSASDVVTDTSTTTRNAISSTVTYTLPTNVNALIFTGTAALKATGNSGNDSLTANTGADTLVAGSGTDTLVSGTTGTDSLVGGSGNDLFFVNTTADKVTDTSGTSSNAISSIVTYTLPTDVNTLIFTGTAALQGTANSGNDSLTANTGSDTLVAAGAGNDTLVSGATGTDSLVGGTGNDTFVINNSADKVTDTSTTASNLLVSSVTYTLPTDVNALVLSGTGALVGTGNAHTDSITAGAGVDTLVAGGAVATLIGGSGNDTFVINSASDVITDTSTTTSNTLWSTVTYTLPTNVNALLFSGTAALVGTANGGNDSITANTGADTLVAAGVGNDTLVAGSTGTDSLVGGTGNDTFVVDNTSDIVTDTSATASNTIVSSVNYTLPTDVQYLTLTGTSALTGTGNSLLDLIVGNTGNDTLTAGSGIAALEGGRTAGSDQIKASSNQAALIGGAGASTITGGAFKDFYAAGLVSDTITTGATANVVSVNKGDGATTLAPTTGATNVLSLGAGIDTESLYFTKTGNNLILTDGVAGDSITFNNWYVGTADQDYTTLQVAEIASANYNSGGSDGLRNKALEAFNFTSLVAAYNMAGSPSNWALSTDMPSAQLSSSSTADFGGDLAYYFGLNGNLTGVDLSDVQSTLTNASFATATQTIDAFSGISGGGGLHVLVTNPGAPSIQPVTSPITSTIVSQMAASEPSALGATNDDAPPLPNRGVVSHPRDGVIADVVMPRMITPRRGIDEPVRSGATSMSFVPVAASDAATSTIGLESRTVEPVFVHPAVSPNHRYVDPINVAWLTLHGALDEINDARFGGAESTILHEEMGAGALLAATPADRLRSTVGNPGLSSPLDRRRAM